MLGNRCVEVHARQKKAEEDIGLIVNNLREMAAILKEDKDEHATEGPEHTKTTRYENFCSWGENNDAELG